MAKLRKIAFITCVTALTLATGMAVYASQGEKFVDKDGNEITVQSNGHHDSHHTESNHSSIMQGPDVPQIGDTITIDGVKEKVIAIGENGEFITEVVPSEIMQYFYISDNYDLPGYPTTSKLLERKNLSADLKNLYKSLECNRDFEYLELYDYFLQYSGAYHNGERFVENPDSMYDKNELQEVIEQKCLINGKEELLTNIYGFFIGEKEFRDFLSSSQIAEGRGFESADYVIQNNTIPVILGNNYRTVYNLNDEFQAYYMGEKSTFKVIGFLKKGAEINVAEIIVNFNDYVLVPAFNEVSGNANKYSNTFEASHYINKTTKGLIATNENIKASKTIAEFKDIADRLGLEYSCIKID